MALQPVDMGLPIMRELGAKWIEEMVEYISDNPQFVVRGFIRSGISLVLDGINIEEDSEEDSSDDDYEEDNDSGKETSDEEETSNGEEASDEDEDSGEEETGGSMNNTEQGDENGIVTNYQWRNENDYTEAIVISSCDEDSNS